MGSLERFRRHLHIPLGRTRVRSWASCHEQVSPPMRKSRLIRPPLCPRHSLTPLPIAYSHLNGKPVASISVSQSWIFRFGTAFAFLVKVAFAMSVAASYVQYQWFKFRHQSFRMDEIDSLTAVLENVVYVLSTRVFLRQPVLLLVAIVSWYQHSHTQVSKSRLTPIGPYLSQLSLLQVL